MISKISITLGIVGCIISVFVAGTYMGYLNGSNFCEVKYPIINGGWVSDLNPYYTYFDRQRITALFLMIFLIGKWFKPGTFPSLVYLSLLLHPIYANAETIYYKIKLWDESDKYLMLERMMLNYEIGINLILLTLVIWELILIGKNYPYKKDGVSQKNEFGRRYRGKSRLAAGSWKGK